MKTIIKQSLQLSLNMIWELGTKNNNPENILITGSPRGDNMVVGVIRNAPKH